MTGSDVCSALSKQQQVDFKDVRHANFVPPTQRWSGAMRQARAYFFATEIADVELGAMICNELRELRRKNRPLYKRTVDRF